MTAELPGFPASQHDAAPINEAERSPVGFDRFDVPERLTFAQCTNPVHEHPTLMSAELCIVRQQNERVLRQNVQILDLLDGMRQTVEKVTDSIPTMLDGLPAPLKMMLGLNGK